MIELYIPLPPVPWQASIKGKYTFYDPKEKEKRCIRFYIKDQYEGDPLIDYIIIFFQFWFKIPKKLTKKQRDIYNKGKLFPTRSDCTNLQKLYEDCLKGTVIKDDRQVIKITSEKHYGPQDGINIKVYTLDEYSNYMKEIMEKNDAVKER